MLGHGAQAAVVATVAELAKAIIWGEGGGHMHNNDIARANSPFVSDSTRICTSAPNGRPEASGGPRNGPVAPEPKNRIRKREIQREIDLFWRGSKTSVFGLPSPSVWQQLWMAKMAVGCLGKTCLIAERH